MLKSDYNRNINEMKLQQLRAELDIEKFYREEERRNRDQERTNLERQINKLTSDGAKERAAWDQERGRLQRAHGDLQTKLQRSEQDLKQQLSKLTRDRNQDRVAWDRERGRLQQVHVNMKTKLQNCEEELNRFQTSLQQEKYQHSASQIQIHSLQGQLSDVANQTSALQSEIAHLNYQLGLEIAAKNKVLKREDRLEDELDHVRKRKMRYKKKWKECTYSSSDWSD